MYPAHERYILLLKILLQSVVFEYFTSLILLVFHKSYIKLETVSLFKICVHTTFFYNYCHLKRDWVGISTDARHTGIDSHQSVPKSMVGVR